MLVYGMVRLDFLSFLLDLIHLGLVISLQGSSRLGFSSSVYGMSLLGFFMSILDFVHLGSSSFLQALARFDLLMFALWHVPIGIIAVDLGPCIF